MLLRTLAGAAVGILCSVTLAAPAARADFTLVSQDLTVSRASGMAAFSLTFNQTPNFNVVDADGTPAESFQVEFDGAVDAATQLPDGPDGRRPRGRDPHGPRRPRPRPPPATAAPAAAGGDPWSTPSPSARPATRSRS